MLLAIGEYRDQAAASRRKLFAQTFSTHTAHEMYWADVSKRQAPQTLRTLALRILEGLAEPKPGEGQHYDWQACEISHTLKSVDTANDKYSLTSEYKMSLVGADVVLAVASNEVMADWICSEFPEVVDIFRPLEGGRFDVTLAVRGRAPANLWRSMYLKEDRDLLQRVHSAFPETTEQSLVFWRSEPTGIDGTYECRLTCNWELRLSDGFIHWSAPHRVWLRRLTVDASILLPISTGPLEVIPSLAMRPRLRLDQRMGTVEVEVENWVAAGGSIDVYWSVG
jgi:hypothetical protein